MVEIFHALQPVAARRRSKGVPQGPSSLAGARGRECGVLNPGFGPRKKQTTSRMAFSCFFLGSFHFSFAHRTSKFPPPTSRPPLSSALEGIRTRRGELLQLGGQAHGPGGPQRPAGTRDVPGFGRNRPRDFCSLLLLHLFVWLCLVPGIHFGAVSEGNQQETIFSSSPYKQIKIKIT